GTLTGGSNNSVSLGNSNTIGTLADFVAGTDLTVNNVGDLTLAGLVSAPGTVDLVTSGTIIEATGAELSAGLLIGSAAAATLDQSNFVAALGNFSATSGAFVL